MLTTMKSLPYACILALLAHPCFARPEASFDCAKASTAIEKLICSNDELANLDRSLASYYSAARTAFEESRECLRSDQVRWLREIRNRCADAQCLEQAYLDRLAELDAVQPGVSAIKHRELPARPPLIAIVPHNGDAESIPQQPSREVRFVGRYAFHADYGLTFVDEQERRYVLTALNQSVPEILPAIEKEDVKVIVRGKALEKKPDPASYPGLAPPDAELDPHACVFVYRVDPSR